ncbi:MAG: HAMP domain-containing histidine kinase [Butyricicoccus sp.]|nr:HAMP domain-containing histidine kinase [Butyricicoccus sp.]
MKNLTHKMPAKIIAFCLAVLMLCAIGASVLGIAFCLEMGVYTWPINDVKVEVFRNDMYGIARQMYYDVVEYKEYDRAAYRASTYSAAFQVMDASDGSELWSSEYYAAVLDKTALCFSYLAWEDGYRFRSLSQFYSGAPLTDYENPYVINVAVDPYFPVTDSLSFINACIDLTYALRYAIYGILAGAALLLVAALAFLIAGAGRRAGREELVTSWFTKIPLDLLAAAVVLGGTLAIAGCLDLFYWSDVGAAIIAAGGFLVLSCVFVGCCVSVAVRAKAGTLWKNTVIWMACRMLWRVWLAVWRAVKAIWRGLRELAGNLPLLWKVIVGLLALYLAEFIFHLACFDDPGVLLFFWFVERLALALAVLAITLMLRRLQKGGQSLAAGDLSYQVDTSRMLWDFKKHGEDLNSIALGLNRAVEERLKSERMKTELITNVSHDIKTPLTSIINYSDLICKENSENEKVREYSAVLLRQSERLKKLIDDLVDASKASTGNVDVNLGPFELDVLLTQTAGEYGQRLADCRLELITKRPEKSLRIMADGRHMWRVFDNLMNNICKYALPGTRVYLTVEDKLGQAVISFKNTSRNELDVSPDELMERFVRGDSSRSTEGSGLGLSIARSLTELQGGTLELTVDGDLFKAVLTFNEI